MNPLLVFIGIVIVLCIVCAHIELYGARQDAKEVFSSWTDQQLSDWIVAQESILATTEEQERALVAAHEVLAERSSS